MSDKTDPRRVTELLKEAMILLCKNGLRFKSNFSIQALIGITLDEGDVFLVNIHETVSNNKDLVQNTDPGTGGEEPVYKQREVVKNVGNNLGSAEFDSFTSRNYLSPEIGSTVRIGTRLSSRLQNDRMNPLTIASNESSRTEIQSACIDLSVSKRKSSNFLSKARTNQDGTAVADWSDSNSSSVGWSGTAKKRASEHLESLGNVSDVSKFTPSVPCLESTIPLVIAPECDITPVFDVTQECDTVAAQDIKMEEADLEIKEEEVTSGGKEEEEGENSIQVSDEDYTSQPGSMRHEIGAFRQDMGHHYNTSVTQNNVQSVAYQQMLAAVWGQQRAAVQISQQLALSRRHVRERQAAFHGGQIAEQQAFMARCRLIASEQRPSISDYSTDELSPSSLPSAVQTQTTVYPLKCPYCYRSFAAGAHLKNHLRLAHKDGRHSDKGVGGVVARLCNKEDRPQRTFPRTRTENIYRTTYNRQQCRILEEEFSICQSIDRNRRKVVANLSGLSDRQVKLWFQNARAREQKRKRRNEGKEALVGKGRKRAARSRLAESKSTTDSCGTCV